MRATTDGHITGHAAVFNQEFVLWDDESLSVVETVKPGTFSRALREKQDVRALFNHEPNNLLGRTKASTLALKQDSIGLYFDIEPADTQTARDVYTLVKRGDITGCSFAFTVTKENVTELKKSGKIVRRREIEDVDLFDVGPVTYPAYSGTDVNARSMELRAMMFPEGVPASVLRLVPNFRRQPDVDDRTAILREIDERMMRAGLTPRL
jgi:HK97 family phage prohead protease